MELSLIGFPQSGKTTVFNALTRGKMETAYSPGSHIGVVKVPDPRLESLAELLKPKRVVPAEVQYVDHSMPAGLGKGEGIGGQFLAQLSQSEALIHVVRAFNGSAPGDLDRDVWAMDMELILSDLTIVERRKERLKKLLKGVRGVEREANLKELALFEKLGQALENNRPIREQDLSPTELKLVGNYQFLTAKPMLLIFNIGEGSLAQASRLEEELYQRYCRPHVGVAVLSGKLEMELCQLEEPDAEVFRREMGLAESGLNRVINLSYDLLELVTFFTIASGEVKAWPVRRGTTVQRAAGRIHTDMERGFIRAEVISHDDLVRCGSLQEARSKGLLRLEGKNYLVRDGDVITILFSPQARKP